MRTPFVLCMAAALLAFVPAASATNVGPCFTYNPNALANVCVYVAVDQGDVGVGTLDPICIVGDQCTPPVPIVEVERAPSATPHYEYVELTGANGAVDTAMEAADSATGIAGELADSLQDVPERQWQRQCWLWVDNAVGDVTGLDCAYPGP